MSTRRKTRPTAPLPTSWCEPSAAPGPTRPTATYHSRILDVAGHKTLWVSPLRGGVPNAVFAFPDPNVRIDYPVWSPDGNWVLFDRFWPQGGDIWVMSGLD